MAGMTVVLLEELELGLRHLAQGYNGVPGIGGMCQLVLELVCSSHQPAQRLDQHQLEMASLVLVWLLLDFHMRLN